MVKILNKCILSILVYYNLFYRQTDRALFPYPVICPYTGILAVFMK